MKTYRGVVVFRYYQEMTVEADDEDQAERLMFETFDIHRADGECQVYDLEEVTGGVQS